MTMLTHHPHEALLLDYVTKTLDPAMALAVGLHAGSCSQCQGTLGLLQAVGGGLLTTAPEVPVSGSLKEGLMAALEGPLEKGAMAGEPAKASELIEISSMLERLVRSVGIVSLDDLDWRRLGGYGEADLPVQNAQARARLLRLSAGAKMPRHTHQGNEITLVLEGSFKDAAGDYRQGDFIAADGSIDHRPEATGDETCLCLAITDAPLKLTGPIGTLLNPFLAV